MALTSLGKYLNKDKQKLKFGMDKIVEYIVKKEVKPETYNQNTKKSTIITISQTLMKVSFVNQIHGCHNTIYKYRLQVYIYKLCCGNIIYYEIIAAIICRHGTWFPPGLEIRENLEKWEGIFQSGKSVNFVKTGKVRKF